MDWNFSLTLYFLPVNNQRLSEIRNLHHIEILMLFLNCFILIVLLSMKKPESFVFHTGRFYQNIVVVAS